MRLRNIKGADKLVKQSDYVIDNPFKNKGKWNKETLYIEIGMGKGDFIINEALNNPNIYYVGIEKYESVLLRAIEKLNKLKEDNIFINNLKLICIDASKIEEIFYEEVDKIYLNFSDPWPKNKHKDRRLTSPIFIDRYKNIVRNKLLIEMKTDNDNLFDYSTKVFKKLNFKINEINKDYAFNKNNVSKTEYEKKFINKNKNINYISVELLI